MCWGAGGVDGFTTKLDLNFGICFIKGNSMYEWVCMKLWQAMKVESIAQHTTILYSVDKLIHVAEVFDVKHDRDKVILLS